MTKNNFIKFPCFQGFNYSKRITYPLIAKVLKNFASTNPGYGGFFTVSFKYIIFNRKIFVEFYKILLTHYHLGGLNLGMYYSISFKLQLGVRRGFIYIDFGNLEFIFNSNDSFKVLFDKTNEKLHSEFDVIHLIRCSGRIVLFFHPLTPTASRPKLMGGKVNVPFWSQRRSYFTSSKVNIFKESRDKFIFTGDKDDKLLKISVEEKPVSLDWMHVKTPVKLIEDINPQKIVDINPQKIVINGIVFNKLNNEFWIDDFSNDVDYKERLGCIESILSDIASIASPGFLNTRDLTNSQFTVISKLINHFTDKEVYIKGGKVTESYVWIYQVLMVNLYNYTLKLMHSTMVNTELETDSDLIANYENLSGVIYEKIDPSIRIKIQKRGLSIIQNIYTGFDTEYVNKGDPMLNELISVQLAVNTKTLLKIPKYTEYELSTLNVQTGEEHKINKSRDENFKYYMVENSLVRCIKEIRSLRYKKNDLSISILIEGLQRLNIPFMEKDDCFVFSFPRTPIQPYIYYEKDPKDYSYYKKDSEGNYIKEEDKGGGFGIKNMIDQSNLIGEDHLKNDYDRLIDLLKGISSAIKDDLNADWIKVKEKYNILDPIKSKIIPEEALVKRMSRVKMTSFTDDKVSVTKIRNNYLIAHWTTADLPMFNDFEELKKVLVNIVNNSFVTLGKPVLISNTNVFIRDSMLLAPQGHKSLESVGSLYGGDFKKVDIAKNLTEDQKDELTKDLTKEQKENVATAMNGTKKVVSELQWQTIESSIADLLDNKEKAEVKKEFLLKVNKEKFDEYAINDAIIPLIHACYMEDFNFNLKTLGIPLTLSSLSKTYIKHKWDLMGYKGYQLSPKYFLGDTPATLTPKGLLAVGKTGLKLNYYIGNYKGGRNEAFMYGVDENVDRKWIDYDLISAYTTAMATMGNPDYNKGRVISVKELNEMCFKDILYSYIILAAKFKFKEEILYPSIACFENEKGDTVCFPRIGEEILTGPEYILAKSQGCKLKITDIYYIPFEKDKEGNLINQPFKGIMDEIQRKRREYPKGTIGNLIYKEMGNSGYGSVVMGISNKKKFDVKSGGNVRINANFLSNPIIASWITGFIRSVVGECLDKISKIKGGVISVTTDGFLTDVENLELKLIGEKTYFINRLKALELKIKEDNKFLFNNFDVIKEELSVSEENRIISLLNKLKSSHFDLQGFIKLIISELNWEGEDSLLKEYEKVRLDLCGDPSGSEIKKDDTEMISVGTRIQIGRNTISALTGFQSRNYNRKEVYDLIKDGIRNDDKCIAFTEKTLRSALEIYKKGGHVTQKYKDKLFRLQFDNKRLIVLPEDCKDTKDFSNKMLVSVPVPDKDLCSNLRFLFKYDRQSIYNKHTSTLSGNKYKNYTDMAIRNFLKGLLSDPQQYNLKTKVERYSELIDFIKNYDNNVRISKQSLSNLKNRPITFKPVPYNKETLKFVEYVKTKYKEFNDEEFFRKIYIPCSRIIIWVGVGLVVSRNDKALLKLTSRVQFSSNLILIELGLA